jgi:hypothetical protein
MTTQAEQGHDPDRETFEYLTYTEKGESCPSCGMPIPLSQLVRRGVRVEAGGGARVAYWHTRCVRADGSRR